MYSPAQQMHVALPSPSRLQVDRCGHTTLVVQGLLAMHEPPWPSR